MLQSNVSVNDTVIRLGDLFSNAGERSEAAVAYAPAPGKRASFDARWLYRAARAYGLNWRPMSRLDRAVVERESIVIERAEITDSILSALVELGVESNMALETGNRMLRIHVPVGAAATLNVEDVTYDRRSQRFAAMVSAPADDPNAKRIRVTGRLHRISTIPVLARRMLKGDIISKRDIKWVETRVTRLQPDTIIDPSDIIGKTPKRVIRAGTPVRLSAVQRPILVPKGSLVTMTLISPYMTLTSKGRALDNGSIGDTIRVTNTQRKSVVDSVVTGNNKVSVRPLDHVVMN